MEWIPILTHEKVTDKVGTLLKLKYEMTYEDLEDIKEYLEIEDYIANEKYKEELKRNKGG